jgi:nitric oxide reductase large subunit
MSDDLVKRLTIKAGVMEMGEKIAWGSDTSLMREAADRIEALTEQLEAARADAKEAEAYAEGLERDLKTCRMAQVVMENGIAQVEGEFARAMKHVMDYSNDRHLVAFARATLAEIEGETR